MASLQITCVRCAQVNKVQITIPEPTLTTHLPSVEIPKTETPAPTGAREAIVKTPRLFPCRSPTHKNTRHRASGACWKLYYDSWKVPVGRSNDGYDAWYGNAACKVRDANVGTELNKRRRCSINPPQKDAMLPSKSIVHQSLPLNRKLSMLDDARIVNDTDVRVECGAHVNTTETERCD